MNFRRHGRNLAISECGNYEIRIAYTATGKAFHNAWHVPTGKHIDAGYDREAVKGTCVRHSLMVPGGT